MQHEFFEDINWERISKKEVVPPWVPDLYTFHASKQIPLKQVFQKHQFREDQLIHNKSEKSDRKFEGDIEGQMHKSNDLHLSENNKINLFPDK